MIRAFVYEGGHIDFEMTDIETWEYINDQYPRRVKLKNKPYIYLVHSWNFIDENGEYV